MKAYVRFYYQLGLEADNIPEEDILRLWYELQFIAGNPLVIQQTEIVQLGNG